MTKPKKILALFMVVILLAALCATGASAATSNLPDGFLIDDENGISVTDDGEYFLSSDHLMPGDVITRSLTLRNLNQGEPFQLHLLGDSPVSTGEVDWLDNLHLQISLDGTELYSGRLRGDGGDTRGAKGNGVDLINTGVDLGQFKTGDQRVLKFVVKADAGHLSATDLWETSTAKITWVFHAVKNAVPDNPVTGGIARYGLFLLLISLVVLCAVFYMRYRKLKGL
jgi:hypothetical protein